MTDGSKSITNDVPTWEDRFQSWKENAEKEIDDKEESINVMRQEVEKKKRRCDKDQMNLKQRETSFKIWKEMGSPASVDRVSPFLYCSDEKLTLTKKMIFKYSNFFLILYYYP